MGKLIRQHDKKDCGPACLATICRFYGLKIPLVKMRELTQVDKQGVSLFGLTEASKKLNIDAKALQGNWSELLEEIKNSKIKLPIIAHVITSDNLDHYIVVIQISRNKIKVFDPAKGKLSYTFDSFNKIWTGYLITFEMMKEFKPDNLEKHLWVKYFQLLIKQRKSFLIILLISLFFSLCSILTSYSYKFIIDRFVLQNNTLPNYDLLPVGLYEQLVKILTNIQYFFLAMIILYLVRSILDFVRGIIQAKLSQSIEKNLMVMFNSHVLKLPMSYYHTWDTGEILSRYFDIGEIRNLISNSILSIIIDTFMIIAAGIVLLSINSYLFYIVFIMILLYIVVTLSYRKPISIINRKVMESKAKLTTNLNESLDGIETIKAIRSESSFHAKFIDLMNTYTKNVYKSTILELSLSNINSLIESVGGLIILWIGVVLVINNIITLGTLLTFESLVLYFFTPIQRVLQMQINIQRAIIAADRVNDILENTDEELIMERNSELKSLKEDIVFNNISFGYGARNRVLYNINISIDKGSKVCIIGKNGCGKSTLVRLLSSFFLPQEGSISIGTENINKIPLDILRSKIAYISQESCLFTGSLGENLFSDYKKEKKQYYKEFLLRCHIDKLLLDMPFDLDIMINEQGINLSGGQRQILIIARALLTRPDIIIFDEATCHLDKEKEKSVFSFLCEYYSDITCIFIAHNLILAENCDKVIVLNKGKVIYEDTYATLKNKEIYM